MTEGKRSTVWITGSAGFLGKRLATHLASQGHSLIGLSRKGCSTSGRSIAIDLATDDAPAALTDLIDESGVPEVVVHTASRQPGAGAYSDFFQSNVQTTINLLEAFKHRQPRLFIYTSTQSVYSPTASLPVKEASSACGTLPYSATKRWSEQMLSSLGRRACVRVLRLPSLYGKGQSDSFIDGLAGLALRNQPIELFSRGELIRDALHVNDVIGAITSCLQSPWETSFAVMNLGCGRPIRTNEYAQALVRALESESEIIPIDRPASQFDLYADIEQARKSIGFQPTPLDQSMKMYADELRA